MHDLISCGSPLLFRVSPLLLLVALATPFPQAARASSPEAWAAYGQKVLKACRAVSALRQPVPLGARLDLPDADGALLSALLLEGQFPQPHMASRRGRELCLYDARTGRARVADAEPLLRQRRP